jgi:hypothetical protein
VSDDDVNYVDKGTVTTSAVIGFAENALSDSADTFGSIDHRAKLIVNVGDGELNTVTWDEIFANGTTNLAALRSSIWTSYDSNVEVFQFRVATSLGGGRYGLSELVRAMYGTEGAAFNHRAGDTFVLLNGEGMLRIGMEPGSIGSFKDYKAVSLGRPASSVSSISSETIGYGLKPLGPADVKLDRTPADGSILFTWGRRTRMSHNAIRQIMPLGESSEAYEIVIYVDSSYNVVKSVYRAYTTSFSYFPAADGYTQLGAFPYRIFQLSDTAGRGIPFPY